MGRKVWIQLDNRHSSVRVSGVWHPDPSREARRCDPVLCLEREPNCLPLCGQHCCSLCGTSFPHGLPQGPCQSRQSELVPEYMVFCCHGGPGLSLSLLSVLPTLFEEQVQYSRHAHYPLQYCINKQQTLRYGGCVQTVNCLSYKQTPQDNAAPILFYKDA